MDRIRIKNIPALDKAFIPFGLYMDEFSKDAEKPVRFAFERENGNIEIFDTFIHENNLSYYDYLHSEDAFYVERVVKFMLWSAGAFRIYVCGCENAARHIKSVYSNSGARSFDVKTMERIYERPFEVLYLPFDKAPEPRCRGIVSIRRPGGASIGIDAGCSNIKVCAVSDGRIVYTKKYPWTPSEQAGAEYHINALECAVTEAWEALGRRADRIGISTAGVFVNSKTRISSLFRSISENDFTRKIYSIYPDICRAFNEKTGCKAELSVVNDGDAAALCAAHSLGEADMLGVSMGTSLAGGYAGQDGNITGKLNELAFIPVDVCNAGLPDGYAGIADPCKYDAWSGDFGCGVRYLSSEAVIRLAEGAGINFTPDESVQSKVIKIQRLAEQGDGRAAAVFETVGCYLAHSVYTYYKFYKMKHTAVMGGISAGPGGRILLRKCREVLADEYGFMKSDIVTPPDDMKSFGQSYAAALL